MKKEKLTDLGLTIEEYAPNTFTIEGNSGEYDGEINNETNKLRLTLISDYHQFSNDTWEEQLGPDHVFVILNTTLNGEVDADGDIIVLDVDGDKFKELI